MKKTREIILFSLALLFLPLWASAQTLQNRWSFNAPASDTTVTDSVSGVVATLEGDASLDGMEVNLDGTTGTYVELGANLLTSLTTVTCEGWVDSAASPDNVHLFEFSDGNGTGNEYMRYILHDDGNADNFFELADFGGTTGDPGQGLHSAFGWGGIPVHVVCVYDPVNGFQAVYTNGVLEASRAFPANQTTLSSVSPNEASLGQSPWYAYGDPYMAGSIREFRIWNGALNPLQVAGSDVAGPGTTNLNPGTVTSVGLQVAYQMTLGADQQALVMANASAIPYPVNIAPIASYASGNTNILTVNSAGQITAVNVGSATLSASYGGLSSTQTITVVPPSASIKNRWSFYVPPAGSLTVTDSVGGVVSTLNGDANLDGAEVNLDGTSGTYVELGTNLLAGVQSVTFEGWLTTNSVSPDNVHLFSFDDGNGTGNDYLRYILHDSGNARNFMELANVPAENNQLLSAPVGFGGSGLLHIACIYDPVTHLAAIFTNGVLEVYTNGSGVNSALSGISPRDAVLGRSPWFAYGDPYLKGSISEFRIYSGQLSPQQIAIDYQKGAQVFNNSGPGALISIHLQVKPTMQAATTQNIGLIANYSNLTNFDLVANNYGASLHGLTVTSANTNIITVNGYTLTGVSSGSATITAIYQGTTNNANVTVLSPPLAPLLYRWSFNAPIGSTTVTDSVSGVVATLEGDAMLTGTNVTLDGTTGTYVELGGGLLAGLTNDQVTCEGWAESAASPDNVHLFEFSDGVGTGNEYMRYNMHSGNENFFELADFGGTTGDPGQNLTAAPGLKGAPVHIVCVYDGADGYQAIYTNGVLEASRTFPANQTTLASVSTNEAALGKSPWWAYGDPYMAGSITEFRIYGGRLLPSDIAASDLIGPSQILTNKVSLTTSSSNGSLKMQWPVAAPGFTLLSSPTIGNGTVWTPVNITPSVVGTANVVALTPGRSSMFFKLAR